MLSPSDEGKMDYPDFQSGSTACGGESKFKFTFINHPPKGACGDLTEDGIFFLGDEIGEIIKNILSSQMCAKLCKDETMCVLWTYYKDLNRCHLKSSYTGRIAANTISGQKPCA